MGTGSLRFSIVGLIILVAGHCVAAAERRWDARALDAEAVTTDVRLTADGAAIELERGELIEDDGPAAGYSYLSNEERLSDRVWIKKQLVVAGPQADKATLLVGARGTLRILVNGVPQALTRGEDAGSYWQAYVLPPESLKSGSNEIVIHGSGKVWIARDNEFAAGSRTRTRHPNRSAKSTDGGRTWDDERLGTEGNVDGEHYVRLFLDRYRPEGSLVLPVLDVGNLQAEAIAPALSTIGSIRVRIRADTDAEGSVTVCLRTGTTPVPARKNWSDWQDLGTGGVLEQPAGRYVQVAIMLKTENPRKSPRLREVLVEAQTTLSSDWLKNLTVLESHSEKIVRTSIPFEYEPFDQPRLKTLRERYELDKVTADADGEFELIRRLAAWSARQWRPIGHLAEAYPPWDALEILKPHRDGTPVGGFCQQYNVVFLQACESYGMVGRAVSLGPGSLADTIRGGHEVVEVWSNEYRKWVYMDGNHAWYFADRESGTPLSLLELRQRQIAAFRDEPYPPVELVRIIDTGQPWDGLKSKPPFAELRLIPRSNFLEAASPLPLNQGMRGCFWTGHYVWTDEELPAPPLYGHRVSNRRNWEWTLNQGRYVLEATETPGTLRVHLETETPHFDSFLAAIDGADQKPVSSGFLWKLHFGVNRLEVRPRNSAGRQGIASWVVLDYRP